MKKNIFTILLFILMLTSCGKEAVDNEEDVPFGDIDTTKEYVIKDYQAPSAVIRKKGPDIRAFFPLIPLNETDEMVSAPLKAVTGDEFTVERFQFNGVYFDVNQVANQHSYKLGLSDGIVQIIIPNEKGNPVVASVAQIADSSVNDKELSYSEIQEVADIVDEYNNIYMNTENQDSDEYGNFYTYDKYVEWMDSHEKSKYNISMYSPEQILSYAIEIFGIDKKTEDFYINTNAELLECSDWYRVRMSFRYENNTDDIIEISLKTSTEGVFLFMTTYPYGSNTDSSGNIIYTPTMIINIAQDNYFQIAEDYKTKSNRENYENGFR